MHVCYSERMRGTYFRWTRVRAKAPATEYLKADILGSDINVVAMPESGEVHAVIPDRPLDADEARMIGVRLIEAAALADNGRSVREP